MFDLLQGENNKKWIGIFFTLCITLIAVFYILTTAVLKVSVGNESIFWFIVMSLVPSAVISISGYKGLKYLGSLTMLGVILGLGFMIYYYNRGYDFDGLVGGLLYIYSSVGGILLGAIVQVISYFRNK